MSNLLINAEVSDAAAFEAAIREINTKALTEVSRVSLMLPEGEHTVKFLKWEVYYVEHLYMCFRLHVEKGGVQYAQTFRAVPKDRRNVDGYINMVEMNRKQLAALGLQLGCVEGTTPEDINKHVGAEIHVKVYQTTDVEGRTHWNTSLFPPQETEVKETVVPVI